MSFYNLSSAIESRRSMLEVEMAMPTAANLVMKDNSVFSRVGFRGKGVEGFLTERGYLVPAKPNQSVLNESGLLVLRLSQSEFWLIDSTNDNHEAIYELEIASQNLSAVYRLYCQHSHACFAIKGENVGLMFAKICGVDLRDETFAVNAIAQTSVARTNAIIVRQIISGEEVFILLADMASSVYLWHAIDDAITEFK